MSVFVCVYLCVCECVFICEFQKGLAVRYPVFSGLEQLGQLVNKPFLRELRGSGCIRGAPYGQRIAVRGGLS